MHPRCVHQVRAPAQCGPLILSPRSPLCLVPHVREVPNSLVGPQSGVVDRQHNALLLSPTLVSFAHRVTAPPRPALLAVLCRRCAVSIVCVSYGDAARAFRRTASEAASVSSPISRAGTARSLNAVSDERRGTQADESKRGQAAGKGLKRRLRSVSAFRRLCGRAHHTTVLISLQHDSVRLCDTPKSNILTNDGQNFVFDGASTEVSRLRPGDRHLLLGYGF